MGPDSFKLPVDAAALASKVQNVVALGLHARYFVAASMAVAIAVSVSISVGMMPVSISIAVTVPNCGKRHLGWNRGKDRNLQVGLHFRRGTQGRIVVLQSPEQAEAHEAHRR